MQVLSQIKDKFDSFRESSVGDKKRVNYPDELLRLVLNAKNSGASYSQLSEASGMSVGGLEKMIRRYREKGVDTQQKVKGGTAAKVAAKGSKAAKDTSKKGGKSHLSALLAPTSDEEKGVALAPRKPGRPPKNAAKTEAPKGTSKAAKTKPAASPKVPAKAAPGKRGRPAKAKVAQVASTAAAPKASKPKAIPPKAPVKESAPAVDVSGEVSILIGGQVVTGSAKDIAKVLQSFQS